MADELNEWQKEFALKDELFQGDFEALELALFRMPNVATMFRNSDLSLVNGAYLRAAIQAGWVLTPETKSMTDKKEALYVYDGVDVDKMHPAKVSWLGKQVVDRHDAVMSEDPKNL